MKIFAILICMLMGLIFQTPGAAKNPLLGKWRYLNSSGGFTGKGTGWDPAERICIEFKKNGQFMHRVNGRLRIRDHYRIVDRKIENEEWVKKAIDFDVSPDAFFEVKKDTLYLREDVADGFSYTFVRRKR